MDAVRADSSAGARRRRARLAALMAVAILAGLVVLAVTKLNPEVVADALAGVDPGWILLALGLMAAAFFARAESWYAVLAAAVAGKQENGTPLALRLHRGTVTRALLIGMACSSVAPGRLGEAVRTWVVARRLGQTSEHFALVVGTVVSQTFLNLLALALLAIAAVLDSTLASARVQAILAAVLLPAGLLGVIFAGPPLLRQASGLSAGRIRRAATWMLKQLVLAREGLAVFRRPRLAVHATATQMGAWALQLGACYATSLALGLENHANLAACAAVLLAVNLTALVPVTPSNIGVFQAACIAVLHPFHVDASRGLAYGLILQAVEIFDALLLGTLALLREGLGWRDVRRPAVFGGADAMPKPRTRTNDARARRRILAAGDRLRARGRLLTRRPGA